MKTPVVLIIFKRQNTTEKVLEVIRQVKPPKLFVVADAPRPNQPGEAEKCAATRAIIDGVDWDCEVFKNYSDVNMGCGLRPATGISWVFEQVEEAIFLEDDCLPHPTFFQFCEELLEKYRDDKRIMNICGTNILQKWQSQNSSYHFSIYGSVWGWASWKRAWKHYDFNMSAWSKAEAKKAISHAVCSQKHYAARKKRFNKACSNQVDIWDSQWLFTCLLQSGLSVVPAVNLISNIGFTQEGTHTTNPNSELNKLPMDTMLFPLNHNDIVVPDRDYDNLVYEKLYKPASFSKKINLKLKKVFKI